MLKIDKNSDVIQQIQKLVSRISQLSETKVKFFEYLIKIEQIYTVHSQMIKRHIENFEGVILKKSFYSINRCQSMKKLAHRHKQFCTFVQNLSKLNLDQIKKINIDTIKLEQKLKKKSQGFVKFVQEYSQSQGSYNKQYGNYQYQCDKFDDMITKCKSLEKPIKFYNLKATVDYSKNLQNKYHDIENKQGQLKSKLQMLDHTRKKLTQNLSQIKQDYLVLLHFHTTNIYSSSKCLVDMSKDQMNNVQSIGPNDKAQGDVFKQQIQTFNDKYGNKNSNREDEVFTDLKDLFTNNQDIQISSDQRLFLDRCQTFIQKKYDSVQEFIDLQKQLIKQILTQIEDCQNLNKQFSTAEKMLFKSNGKQSNKNNVRKYFGQGSSKLVELCFVIIDEPRRRFDKISKNFQSHIQKLTKVLQKKQDQYKKFKKRITQILNNNNNNYKEVQNNKLSITQFKTNIQQKFSLFKSSFENLTKIQNAYDLQFQSILQIYIQYIYRQSLHIGLKYTLKKQRQKFLYNLYTNFNSDGEIIQIVKQDTRYEIFFNDCFKPNLSDQFVERVNIKTYKQTQKTMQKKQNNMRGIIGRKQVGCCGMQRSQVPKYVKKQSFDANLIGQKQVVKNGKLQILDKGLMFSQKSKNPFSEKTQLIVPTKQIMSFSHKILHQGQTAIQILTNMGSLLFLSQNFHEIEQSLEKNLGTKLITRDQSKLQKSNESSFFKQNSLGTTQFKVSFDKSGLLPAQTKTTFFNKNNKPPLPTANTDAIGIKRFIQSWKKTKILSDHFVIQSSQQTGNTIRNDYKFQDEINKFLLKQKRILKLTNPPENSITLNYQWKISFPDMPMLKSFVHGQEVKIDLSPDKINVKATQANRGDSHLFVRKTFYNQITKMNLQKLLNLIATSFEREANLIIQQQPQSEQSSTILLDMENLAIDKQEVQSKHDKIVKRLSSGHGGFDSEKGNSRISGYGS